MTEMKQPYKLYELSDRATLATLSDRLTEIEECLEILEGVDIPEDLHNDYLDMLEELKQTEDDFTEKVDSILSLIQYCIRNITRLFTSNRIC
jgi:hypothetical protein